MALAGCQDDRGVMEDTVEYGRGQDGVAVWQKAIKTVEPLVTIKYSSYHCRLRIRHPQPLHRFDDQNPREEPGALAAPAGICAGGVQQ